MIRISDVQKIGGSFLEIHSESGEFDYLVEMLLLMPEIDCMGTGGSTPTPVQQAAPAISVGEDGKVTASATQMAGYVEAGTKSATRQLSSADDPDFVPENIKDGTTIFGVTGTLQSGTAGVSSFKGRTGAVTPQTGDYTAAMVGARANTWVPTAAQVGAIPASAVSAMKVLTQTEYDALTSKGATTLYLIKE